MSEGDRPRLRLLERPPPIAYPRFDVRANHPSKKPRYRPVLYVGGDHDGRVEFTRCALRWGTVGLLVANSGEEGLEMALVTRPRLVVVDSQQSDMDGESFVGALSKSGLASRVPIVVVSNDKAPRERARFIWAGASAYLSKPLKVAEIDRTVRRLLGATACR